MDLKWRQGIKIAVCAALCMLATVSVFSQNDGSIPEELLRPRREEAPRYPVDVVIGPLGRGQASNEAYAFAKDVAAALLAGNMDAPALSSINKVFLESCMNILEQINPRLFRLGNGREEPDGAVSFLVRFAGREQGITGELFIRFEEQRRAPPPPPPPPEAVEAVEEPAVQEPAIEEETVSEANNQPAPPQNVPAQKAWVFEDLILEEARSREVENAESRQRFDFPPYERFF
ncbi:MAG: hypothetical protein FWD36_04795 [Treponema sp.]|nr:hypothetical protein [Treponema sp.]